MPRGDRSSPGRSILLLHCCRQDPQRQIPGACPAREPVGQVVVSQTPGYILAMQLYPRFSCLLLRKVTDLTMYLKTAA